MSAERTEQPTPKKLRDARGRGEVPRSRDLVTAAAVIGAATGFASAGEYSLERIRDVFGLALRSVSTGVPEPTTALQLCMRSGLEAAAPVLLSVLCVATLAAFLQVGPAMAYRAVSPKLDRLDPWRGARRLFSVRQLSDLALTLLKVIVIAGVLVLVLGSSLRGIAGLVVRPPADVLRATASLGQAMLWRAGAALAVFAVIDVIHQRWRFVRDQRMTREEVKREHRESEGDPHAKQQRERLHREVLEHRTLEEVRRASVLIINPTHLAVALRYDQASAQEAPEVLAKGQDGLARRMMEIAQQEGIPIMQDVPLARALFDLEIGEEIPYELYEAVAIVLETAWAERSPSAAAPPAAGEPR